MPQPKRPKDDYNKRDIFGRNLSYLQSCLPSLEHLDSIDLYSHELESGYTPLHVTLRQGYLRKSFKLYKHWMDEMEYLSHKFGGHVFNQVDKEGMTPLELYNSELYRFNRKFPNFIWYRSESSSLVSWSERVFMASRDVKNSFMALPSNSPTTEYLRDGGGSHILTIGSNVNYQLGTGTKDDRQNMFQLSINQVNKKENFCLTDERFKKVLMTRYHCIIITTKSAIFTCGNGTRGRLGNGITDAPQANFTKILDLSETGVFGIATSNHHSLVLTGSSEVYSWGWNGYGQLGYSTSNKTSDEKMIEKICGSTPKKVSFLDGEDILHIACSKVHSCAITRNGKVFMWGLNLGQMGGSKPVHTSADVEYQGQDGYITSMPVIINLSHLSIEQVICTDYATFIRTEANTLHVYTNYMSRTFKIPLPRARTFKKIDAFAHFTPREVPSKVIDMKCTNIFGNNMCFKYSCGRIGMIVTKEESSKTWTKFTNSLPVTLYWVPNFENRKCLDFAVSAKGKLMVCTLGGEVFTSNGINAQIEKTYSGKLISGRAVGVSCDSSFGSFAITKDEKIEVPMILPKDHLLYDFSQFSPLRGVPRSRQGTIWGVLNRKEFAADDFMGTHNVFVKTQSEERVQVHSISRESICLAPFKHDYVVDLNQVDDCDGAKFDVTFVDNSTGEKICNCHKLILKIRCSKLIKVLKRGESYSTKDDSFQFTIKTTFDSNLWIVDIKHTLVKGRSVKDTLKAIVHFLYTDERPTDQITSKLLFDLVDNSYHFANLSHSLGNLLKKCFQIEKDREIDTPDVIIHLKDGILHAHSLVLSSRSVLFHTFLKRAWCTIDELGIYHINLKHLDCATEENVACILKYIYGVPYNMILEDLNKDHYTEYVQFFLDMLELCDQFNLECFKNFLESVTVKYIDGETVMPILLNAMQSNSQLLALHCCWFLCVHIGLLFSKGNTDFVDQHFDSQIWNLLESVLKDLRSQEDKVSGTSWYEIATTDWMNLFHTNLKAFNERFMDSKNAFAPLFQLKTTEIDGTVKSKSSTRRRSSVQSLNKSRQASFVTNDITCPRRPSNVGEHQSTKINENMSNNDDGTAIDDSDDFIEVIKKPKRKISEKAILPLETSATQLPEREPAGKVVLHEISETAKDGLPSLLSLARETSPGSTEIDASTVKISGMFKKGSQKQRMKQLTEKVESESPKENDTSRKSSWGTASSATGNGKLKNPGRNSHYISVGSSSSSKKNSLPSLYDDDPATSLNKSKKEKKKLVMNGGLKAGTEFVSHGNLGGIYPYVHKTAMATTSVEATPTQSSGPKLSLEERVAAQEFEKWFAKESAKVQKKLNGNNNHNIREELKVMYNAAQTLPEFITDEGTTNKKNNRKLKLKFQNRNKSRDDMIKPLW